MSAIASLIRAEVYMAAIYGLAHVIEAQLDSLCVELQKQVQRHPGLLGPMPREAYQAALKHRTM